MHISLKHMLCRGLFFIFLLACYVSGQAQIKRIGTPFVRNYHPSEINAGTQTWAIDMSGEGMVYFANNDGILEFDGIYWNKYPMPGDIIVRSVNATEDGRIYAGGFNQVGYFSMNSQGEKDYHSLTHLIPATNQNFGEVWKIHELPYGIIFQSYKQLMVYHNDTIDIIKAPSAFHFSFMVNGELYINDQQEGIYRLAPNHLIRIPGLDRLKGQLIWSMVPRGNNILIATADRGIFEFNGYGLKEWGGATASVFKNSQIYCGMRINENTYAFGTIQDGILICDSSGYVFQHINLDKGLQNNTVLSLHLDNGSNLWLGLDNGIDYIEINSPLSYFTHYSNISAGYSAVLHNGILYLGTNRGVFYHEWDKLHSSSLDQDFKIIAGTQGQVWELEVIDNTLFCGHNSGIFTIKGTQADMVSDVQGGWTFIRPEGRDDILICGTYTSLVRFEKVNGKWQQGTEIKGFSESSRFLENAGPNKLWMTHGYLGVFRLHLNDNYDSVFRIEAYNSKNGLPSNENINVYKVFDRAVFTTEEGIYSYNIRTNGFEPDQELRKILPGTDIQKLYQDIQGNIWYFTEQNAGVYRLQEDGNYVNVDVPFRELEGKFITYFQCVYPLDDNNVFFGSQNGFVHYSPKFPKNYQREISSYIRKMIIIGLDSVIQQATTGESSIASPIPYKYNQLRFEYSANDFENPGNILFSSYLEDTDSDWSPWQARPVREYTKLKRGAHRFHVKAKSIFGTESNVSTIAFEIAPPWYLKWYAFILYLLILGTFISFMVVYVRYHMRKSKRQEEERQKRLFRDREKQLKTETLEAEKEVIRLRNEKLSAEMRQKDKELANNTMQMIHNSKMLTTLKKELSKIGKEISDDEVKQHINTLIRKVNREIDTENQWEVFESHFESVHEEFLKRLKSAFPDLTPREMKLCAYLRLNISSKEIATLMNISTRGVEISRYRLRKKLKLSHNTNLTEFIMTF